MTTPLFTWRDVEQKLKEVVDPLWDDFYIDQFGMEFVVQETHLENVLRALRGLFGAKIDSELTALQLESPSGSRRLLSITITKGSALPTEERPIAVQRPLWSENVQPIPQLDFFDSSMPKVAGFYSFKGGVGRTTTLLATLNAALMELPEGQPQILVVDADLEAPGLTWDFCPELQRFSVVDFLSLVHDDENIEDVAIPLAAERLVESVQSLELPFGRRQFYFLPAYRELHQVFTPPISFEQVVRARGRARIIPEIFARLGQKLGVKLVLIDLRAGITEISSPLLLDRRVQSVIVTSCNKQSINGTIAVLNKVSENFDVENAPEIVVSLVPPSFPIVELEDISAQLLDAALPAATKDLTGIADEVVTRSPHFAAFAQELLHYDSVENLIANALPGTELGKNVAYALAATLLPQREEVEAIPATPRFDCHRMSFAHLVAEAKKLEFAEGNYEIGLLPTPALESLSQPRAGTLPVATILGPKGAGKTFAWGQLVLSGVWSTFVEAVGKVNNYVGEAYIFPLLQPASMQDELRNRVNAAELRIRDQIGGTNCVSAETLRSELGRRDLAVEDDLTFWVTWIVMRLGLSTADITTIGALASHLEDKNLNLVLAIDGLEDAFQSSFSHPLSESQLRALRSLLQRLPNEIKDCGRGRIGLGIFLRKDLAEAAISQNFAQYAALYDRYALKWTPTEVLRLVAWTLQRAGFVDMGTKIPNASYEDLREALTSFWGTRLGSSKSKEAYSDRWVIAALSDFQGRVQARDVIRLLRFASDNMGDDTSTKVTPIALKRALPKCSELKVSELETEVAGLKEIFDRFRAVDPGKRAIPFTSYDFDITLPQESFLEHHGIIIKTEAGELYMPEIIRHGLGFSLAGGRRAKVLALYRAALSKGTT